MAFVYDPPDGYRNTTIFPTKPANETEFRASMMTLFDQMAAAVNSGAAFSQIAAGTNRQALINGGFGIAQRGTTLSQKDYVLDRWRWLNDGSGATFQQTQGVFIPGDNRVPGNPKHFYIAIQGGSPSGQTFNALVQRIEDAATFAGGKATFSVYIETVTPGKPITFKMTQNFGTGGSPSPSVVVSGTQFSAAGTFTNYNATFDLPSVTGKTFGTNKDDYLEIAIFMPNNDTFQINLANAQLNQGDTALPFQARSIGEELALCQRYYEKSYNQTNKPGDIVNNGAASFLADSTADSLAFGATPFKTTKRTTPSVRIWGVGGHEGLVYDGDDDRVVSSGSVVDWVSDTNFRSEFRVSGAITSKRMFHWTAEAEL